MKYPLMAVILIVAAYFAWRQLKPKPPPPPPPPPPAILLEPVPALSAEEQAKVLKSANDQDPQVRWEAIVFLDKTKVPAAFEVMFNKLHQDPDVELRIKIIKLLVERKGPTPTPRLQQNSVDSLNPGAVAAPTAQEKRNAEITQNLVWATKDPLPEIRVAALQALDTLGDYSAASAIMDSLRDPDAQVRLQALKTLNSLQDKKAAMIEAERKRQEELRRQAEQGRSGGAGAP